MSEKRYTISCNGMKAEISNVGAQLRSLKDKNGKEYMWSADPAFCAEKRSDYVPQSAAV